VAREPSLWPERAPRWVFLTLFASAPLSGLTATLLLTHHRVLAGVSALASGAALLAGSIQEREAAPLGGLPGRARFTERVLDVVFDASVLVPLAWVMRSGSNWDAILAMAGLGFSYLASYQRARGEALGYLGSEVLSYRLTREGLLVLGLLSGWITATLWAFTILTAAAAAVRAWNILVQERHARAMQEATG
jgi:phosphatidylinositol phosphate synthase